MKKRFVISLASIFVFSLFYYSVSCAKDFVDIIKDYEKIVIDVETVKKTPIQISSKTEEKWGGSGFIISIEDGFAWILTNNHVLRSDIDEETSTEETKIIENKAEYSHWITRMNIRMKAEFVSSNKYFDIGLLKIPVEYLEINAPLAVLGDSDKMLPGDRVIAIGNPYNLDNTATAGIISQVHRHIPEGVSEMPNFVGGDLIQMDAPINPGNSGGPLINSKGEIIGINFAGAGDNLGFAIPINYAKRFLDRMKKEPYIIKGELGIKVLQQRIKKSFSLQDVNDLKDLDEWTGISDIKTLVIMNALTEKEAYGVLITKIEKNSSAERAGLKRGDVIRRFGNKEIKKWQDFVIAVIDAPFGQKVPVEIIRCFADTAKIFEFQIEITEKQKKKQ